MRAPSASSTSALPLRDVAERLPCFATGTPAPATTKAAAVETLNVARPASRPAGVDQGRAGRDHGLAACPDDGGQPGELGRPSRPWRAVRRGTPPV